MDLQGTLKVTRALSDASRLRVVVSLAGVDELCACQITEMLGLSPAAVSRHMGVLLNANLVRSRKDGRWVYYRLSDEFPPLPKQWLMESLPFSREAVDDRKHLEEMLAGGLHVLCRPWGPGGSHTASSRVPLLAGSGNERAQADEATAPGRTRSVKATRRRIGAKETTR